MQLLAEPIEALHTREAALIPGQRELLTLLQLLQNAGNPDLYELVEVACCDREELDPLQQGIFEVLSLFEDPVVEEQPAFFAIKVVTLRALRRVTRLRPSGLSCRGTSTGNRSVCGVCAHPESLAQACEQPRDRFPCSEGVPRVHRVLRAIPQSV